MTSGVPWQLKGVRREVIETAREAARRSGMSVAEWLDTVIVESVGDESPDSQRRVLSDFDDDSASRRRPKRRKYAEYDDRQRAEPGPELSDVTARLDTLSRQIDHLAQENVAQSRQYQPEPSPELSEVTSRLETLSRQIDHLAQENAAQTRQTERKERTDDTPRVIADALSRLDRRLDHLVADGRAANAEIGQRVSAIDHAVARLDRSGAAPAGFAADQEPRIDQALAEIEARQRALDGEMPGPRVEFARAPTQRLPDLEQQLRQLNARLETMRPCSLDNAVETLRDDLAEIGVMLKDALPRQAIEALESEVRSLTSRIDTKRHSGVEGAAIAGIEQGLAEVRDALRGLTPAESLAGFDETVQRLSQKVDGLAGGAQDPAALKQFEGAIVALRGVVSHVASNDALANLSDEVRSLSAKVEQVAGSDAFSMIERRISSIADALQARNTGGQEALDLEAVVASLAEKFEQLQLSRADHAAVAHLEDRIVSLVEKLDASDSRLSQLETIERGLADLLAHLENQRSQATHGAANQSTDTDEIRRDVQRTQDSLEAVHGTLGHVVDRLATIETTMRGNHLPRAANIPQTELAPPPLQPSPPKPMAASPVPFDLPPIPAVTEPPAVFAAPPPPPAPPPLPPPPPISAEKSDPAAQPAPAASANPAPTQDRRPIDPDLPPDHPLEPGDARARGSSPSDRIAASEAALGGARPPVIPDPGGKSNFIAAARRAAQAAIVEAPPPKDKKASGTEPGRSAGPSLVGKLGGQMRKLLVGAGVVLLVLGSVHFAATRLWRSNPSPGTTAQTTPADDSPTITKSEPKAAPAPATPDRRSAVLPYGNVAMTSGLPGGAVFGMPPAIEPDRETTGAIHPAPIAAAPISEPTPATPPSAPTRGPGADRLPPGIGGGGLRAAAVKGDPSAEFEIATRLAEGRGVAQNLAEAATWFERAAGKGLVLAQFRLGGLYEKGLGVRKNLDTARRLYTSAAEAGNGKAMHNLAVLYAEGIGGKPDYSTAARWFRRAADHGVVDAQYNLAILYARGIGVEANLAEAFKWFALASREGDREATRKRDDVAGRLDRQTLAAAMKAAQSWRAQPQPEGAIKVHVPAGGWDGVPAPSVAKRIVGPKLGTKSEAPVRGPAQ